MSEKVAYPIKLVRDRPEGVGDLLFFQQAPVEDRLTWLKLKLQEEVGEYLLNPVTAELEDVYAVVMALGHYMGLDSTHLEDALRNSRRGGFYNGLVMWGYFQNPTAS